MSDKNKQFTFILVLFLSISFFPVHAQEKTSARGPFQDGVYRGIGPTCESALLLGEMKIIVQGTNVKVEAATPAGWSSFSFDFANDPLTLLSLGQARQLLLANHKQEAFISKTLASYDIYATRTQQFMVFKAKNFSFPLPLILWAGEMNTQPHPIFLFSPAQYWTGRYTAQLWMMDLLAKKPFGISRLWLQKIKQRRPSDR